jgi:2-haloacid dehalogenase
MTATLSAIQALTFDVFGTVVDWRGSIIREGRRLGRDQGLRVDWPTFADAWRAGYAPAMERVRRGELAWTTIDVLHRQILDELVDAFGLGSLDEAGRDHLNRPGTGCGRPDAVPDCAGCGDAIVAPLSNGNVALLTNMAKHAGLP